MWPLLGWRRVARTDLLGDAHRVNVLEDRVAGEIRRRGPIPFGEVMDRALYDPDHGFYATGGSAGRRGDFITSPEVGPLFGATVARAIDAWWDELGRPDPFVVVDAGAGPGTLAVAVLRARPSCARALRYVLVERSEAQRARHAERLVLEDPAFAFAPDHGEEAEGPLPPPNVGPIVVSLAEIPRIAGRAVLVANELLDNLPVDLLERRDGAWWEVRVGLGDDGTLVEHLVPAASDPGVDAADGARVPVQLAAADWVRQAMSWASRTVVFDYFSTTAELARRPAGSWLRTYRGHRRAGGPLEDLGAQDITCEVCADQLPVPDSTVSQADWLRSHGIHELVEAGRATWEARKAVGDVAAIEARSRAAEAATLTDAGGLGAFGVLEWTK